MERMGIEALYRNPGLSDPHPGHKVWPYLLREVAVSRPSQIWAADITYLPLARGFAYSFGHHRLALAPGAGLALVQLHGYLFLPRGARRGADAARRPGDFNTDQGGQFTSEDFTDELLKRGIRSSHGRQGAWDRQRLHRAPVAEPQIREGISESIPQAKQGYRSVFRFLQPTLSKAIEYLECKLGDFPGSKSFSPYIYAIMREGR